MQNFRCVIMLVAGVCLIANVSSDGGTWINATGNLGGMQSECGTIQASPFAVPNANLVIAGVSGVGLFSTTNGGTVWTRMGNNAIEARPQQMIFDPDHPGTWWYCGIYHAPGVWRTTDNGATWTSLGNAWHSDGIGVDFTDPQRKTLLAGGHEQKQTLWKSTDGGSTWSSIGASLPGDGPSTYHYIVSAQVYLMGMTGGSGGIYRSTNAGGSWTKLVSGGALTTIIKGSDGTLWCVGGTFGAINKVLKGSSDGSTWTTLTIANISPYGAPPIELPDHSIAVASANGISITSNAGTSWKTVANPIPSAIKGNFYTATIASLVYNSVAGSFYLSALTCENTVSANSIWRYDTLIGASTVVTTAHPGISSLERRLSGAQATFDILGRELDHRGTKLGASSLSATLRILRTESGRIIKKIGGN